MKLIHNILSMSRNVLYELVRHPIPQIHTLNAYLNCRHDFFFIYPHFTAKKKLIEVVFEVHNFRVTVNST